MKPPKNIGDFLAVLSILIGIVLVIFFNWKVETDQFPLVVVAPTKTKDVNLEARETQTSTVFPLDTPGVTGISPTTTGFPVDESWVVQGDGKVAAAKDYVLIYATDKTSAHTRDTDFHNIYLEMNVDVVRLDDYGSYSLLLRRADPCQLYDVRFSNINEKTIQIELRKYFCSDGYKVLNRVEVAVNAYEPYKLSTSIVGGEVVYFSISINGVEELKVQDTNDFIWRGDFGVSVENGEVQFLDINVHE